MGENQEKIETLEQSKQAEQGPTSEQSREGQHPEQPAPKNAQRLGVQTPCAAKGDRCYDCKSPQRICRALVVYWEKPRSMDMEVVLVRQDLGY